MGHKTLRTWGTKPSKHGEQNPPNMGNKNPPNRRSKSHTKFPTLFVKKDRQHLACGHISKSWGFTANPKGRGRYLSRREKNKNSLKANSEHGEQIPPNMGNKTLQTWGTKPSKSQIQNPHKVSNFFQKKIGSILPAATSPNPGVSPPTPKGKDGTLADEKKTKIL